MPLKKHAETILAIPAKTIAAAPMYIALKPPKANALVHVGESALATVIIEMTGHRKIDSTIDITLVRASRLTLIFLQRTAKSAALTLHQNILIGRGAKLHLQNITLGGGEVTHVLRTDIEGKDATSTVDWVFYAHGNEQFSLSALNAFSAARGRGEITMKGVAEGNAHVRVRGMITIGPKGNQTETYLTEDILMLDPTAKVDAIPALEIKTNDVKASHSATVRRVTEEELFYFSSRGIALPEARAMYVQGFLGSLLERIEDAAVREKVLSTMPKQRKIPKGQET